LSILEEDTSVLHEDLSIPEKGKFGNFIENHPKPDGFF
jgi:hypothetical protein